MIKVSVIIPVYNVEKYLAECLDSVLAQTLKDIEIICVNDGSTDGSAEILEKYAAKDKRIRVFTQKNSGLSASRNLGLSKCRGEFVYFLDSDDYIDKQTFEILLNTITRDNSDMAQGKVKCFGSIPTDILQRKQSWFDNYDKAAGVYDVGINLRSEICCISCNKLYKRDIIEKFNIRFPVGLINEDEYWLWAYMIHCKTFSFVDEYLYFYLQRSDSIMAQKFDNPKILDIIDIDGQIYDVVKKYKNIDDYNDILTEWFYRKLQGINSYAFMKYRENYLQKIKEYYEQHNHSRIVKKLYERLAQMESVKLFPSWAELKAHKIPKVSVIVPVYNTEKYLAECLDSVLAQTLENIEVICVNDGSTDDSAAVLNQYAAKDKRVKVINKKNEGAATAKNMGLNTAIGEFVAFMDSDDIYPDENVLKDLYEAAVTHKAKICGGSLYLYSDGKIIPSGETQYVFAANKMISYKDYQYDYGFTRFLYNRFFLLENSIDFPLYRRVEDPPFFIKAMSTATKFYALQRPVYLYRTSHKTIKWTVDMVTDTLRGFYECLQLAAEHKYDNLEQRILSRLNTDYTLNIVAPIYCNAKVNRAVQLLLKKYKKYLHPMYHCLAVSVIISVYNAENCLEECLDSVLAQTLKNIEVICVDNASTDNSLKILRNYAKKDERIKVFTQPASNQSAAMNDGVKSAIGKYVAFLDAADYWRNDTLEILYKQAHDNDLDMLSFGGVNFIDGSRELQENPYYQFKYLPKNFKTNCFNHKQCADFITDMPTSPYLTCYKREFLLKNNITFSSQNLLQDDLSFARALLTAKRCGICKETLYFHRVRPHSEAPHRSEQFSECLQMCEKIIRFVYKMPVRDDVKIKYYNSYTAVPRSVYNGFCASDKKRYKKQLNKFLKEIKLLRYDVIKLFGFIPLLSIEEQ